MSGRYLTLAGRRNCNPNCVLADDSDRDLDDTKSLDSLYTETVNIGGRLYQQLALDRGLGFTPIDEVNSPTSYHCSEFPLLTTLR